MAPEFTRVAITAWGSPCVVSCNHGEGWIDDPPVGRRRQRDVARKDGLVGDAKSRRPAGQPEAQPGPWWSWRT